ncbi:uncharacterized protein [Littorina saxatilis]|uniref:Uncharacterized protein n=1 Tax=Littorina saxatilis TaxID=31220 RepID=A0AAN9BK36_9CAEN
MKVFVAVLVLCAIAHTSFGMTKVCEAKKGKKVVTFSETAETTEFPCKYNAVRRTKCGEWLVTVTPGNDLETDKNKHYVIKTLWVGLENMTNTLKWEGRSTLKIARKYLDNLKMAPFTRKDGFLKTEDIFTYGPRTADNQVSLIEKNGDFKITYNLYDPDGSMHKSSGFRFECFSDTFVPTAYPQQLCGNGTESEVHKFKKSMEWQDNRMATLFFNIFTNDEIAQTESNCLTSQRTMTNKCGTKEKQYMAAKLCWPIVGKPRYQRCISGNMDKPISAFRHCVEYVCSDYKDANSCLALGDELDMCPTLDTITLKVRADCKPDLFST